MDVLEVIHVMQRELVMIQYNRSFTLSEGAYGKVELNLFSICEKRKSVKVALHLSLMSSYRQKEKKSSKKFLVYCFKPLSCKGFITGKPLSVPYP